MFCTFKVCKFIFLVSSPSAWIFHIHDAEYKALLNIEALVCLLCQIMLLNFEFSDLFATDALLAAFDSDLNFGLKSFIRI